MGGVFLEEVVEEEVKVVVDVLQARPPRVRVHLIRVDSVLADATEQHRRRRDHPHGAPGRRGDGAQIGGQIGGGDPRSDG